MTKEALKLALEALEPFSTPSWAGAGVDKANEAITAIHEALAQPAQEPMFKVDVAKRKWESLQADGHEMQHIAFAKGSDAGIIDAWGKVVWLQTTPPLPEQPEERNFCPRCGKRTADIHTCTPPLPVQRPWVGLTEDEIYEIAFDLKSEHRRIIANAIEAKLKEKNNV